ncbi:MAG: mechanosensitive ion channel family protein [Desulfomonilaceae bacterium]|nr:mechanosensitive ion channel family protein [Desulfomonilaceae bacterium]
MLGPNVLRRISPDCTTVAAVVIFSLFFCCLGWCQTPEMSSRQEDKPASTVKVEVKEAEGKKPAEVKVEVGGKEVETKTGDATGKSSPTLLPSPEEKIAPVDTEKIEEAGKRVGEKLDQVVEKSSHVLGDWVTAKAFSGVSWLKLVATVLVFLVIVVTERTVNHLIRRRLQRIESEQRAPTWFEVLLDALRRPLSLFIWVYGFYFAISPLFIHFDLPFATNVLRDSAGTVADVGGLIAVVWLIFRVVRLVDLELKKRAKYPGSRIDDLQVSLVGKTLRWVILITGAIVIVQYLTGIHATPIIASLGIGGLAVALAAKESIANLFGTVTIAFDKPFKVGDRIVIDKYDGAVESVGYRSTKLRLWNGNLVTIPNEKIAGSSVENFARRPRIMWSTNITITYDTPPDKVDQAVELIQELLDNDEDTNKEWPPWVFFDGFNDWSLNIRMMAWFKRVGEEPAQRDYFTWRQRICRGILRRFNEEGIDFAFPTGTTYLASDEKRLLKIMMASDQELKEPPMAT